METQTQIVSAKQQLFTFTVFPEDLNWAGSLFGGKLLAEMDSAAANCVRRILYKTNCDGLVTASLDRVNFKQPAHLGDIIELYSTVIAVGTKSITVTIEVFKEAKSGLRGKICDAQFIFVSLLNGKPAPHNLELEQNIVKCA
jgi:acyl-CoA thioesterase YciA